MSEVVGDYLLQTLIRRGEGYALHRATQRALGREVQLYLFDRPPTRFEDLARRLVRLDHPGLAPVYDAGFAGERCYVATRRVEGPAAETVTSELLAALEHLRGAGLEPGTLGAAQARVSGGQAVLADYVPTLLLGADRPAHQRIGPYELLEQIGGGGMGLVYRARHVELDREVALKLLREEALAPQELQRFAREARAAARLRHPGIVPLFDVGSAGGRHYLALELVRGRTLKEAIPAGGLPAREALAYLAPVARAVHHAHEQGVVHRDLKPSNILLDAEDRPRVTDFGLARELSREEGVTITGSGDVLGTPSYMSPEQARGAVREVGPTSDVFALGAVLYHLLTGFPPYDGESAMEVVLRAVECEPVPPRAANPLVPREVEAICLMAMAPEPARRYPSAAALADDAERFLAGEPVRAAPPTRTLRALRRLRGRWRWIALLAVVALAGGALGLYFRRQAGKSAQALAEERERRRRQAAEAVRREALQARLRSVHGELREVRRQFYIGGVPIRPALDRLADRLRALEPLTQQPDHAQSADLWSTLGGGWYVVGQPRRAEQALERALALDPRDGWAQLFLGRIYLERSLEARIVVRLRLRAREDRDEARRWSRRALEHLGSLGQAEGVTPLDRHLATVYRAVAEARSKEVQRLCDEGLRRFGEQLGAEEYHYLLGLLPVELERKLAALDRAIARRPHYPRAYLIRGSLHPDPARRIADYSRALAIHPRLARGYLLRGRSHERAGRRQAALADYTSYTRLALDDAVGHAQLGGMLAALGRLGEAEKALDRALVLSPTLYSALDNRIRLRRKTGRLALALADAHHWVGQEPRSVDALHARAQVYLAQKREDLALADLDRSISIRPTAMAHVNRGAIHFNRGHFAKAVAEYNRALALHDHSWFAWFNRALAHRELGQLDRAVADYTRAIGLRPTAEIYAQRGDIHTERGDWRSARGDLDRAVQLDGRHWLAWYNLGRLEHRLGRVDRALEYMRRALVHAPAGQRETVRKGIAQVEAGRKE